MTHLHPKDISIVHRKSSCRRGRHRWGTPRQVGGGIMRQVCLACGSVTIDLRGSAIIDEAVAAKHLD